MKNYIVLDGMICNQKDVLCAAFDKGYKQGVKDGKKSVQINETEAYLMGTENAAKQFQPELKRAYNDGLNDAWDCARKIYDMTFGVRDTIFSTHDTGAIFHPYSASEAIAIIKEYEEKQEVEDKEIKVGDEIKYGNRLCVVTRVGDDYMTVVYDSGDGGVLLKDKCQKTGRHFPQIAEMFNLMQEVK